LLRLHIPHEDATLIARAASVTKRSVPEFIGISAAIARAKRVLQPKCGGVLPPYNYAMAEDASPHGTTRSTSRFSHGGEESFEIQEFPLQAEYPAR
jgi:hypothetical protein